MWVLSHGERLESKRLSLCTLIQTRFLYALTIWTVIDDLVGMPLIRSQLWSLWWLDDSANFVDILNLSILHGIPVVNLLFLWADPMIRFFLSLTDLAQMRLPWVFPLPRHLRNHPLCLLRGELHEILLNLLPPLSVSLDCTQHRQLVIWVQLQKIFLLRSVRRSSIFWYWKIGIFQIVRYFIEEGDCTSIVIGGGKYRLLVRWSELRNRRSYGQWGVLEVLRGVLQANASSSLQCRSLLIWEIWGFLERRRTQRDVQGSIYGVPAATLDCFISYRLFQSVLLMRWDTN